MVSSTQIVNCIILCGGSGTRLWPLSREKLPKQFLSLANKDTMLQNTIKRLHMLTSGDSNVKVDKFVFVCNEDHGFIIEQQYTELQKTIPKLSSVPYQIVTEPKGRDTAPAIAISTLICDPNHLSLVVPSDHIFDDKEFVRLVSNKIECYTDSITLFGIRPTFPATAYGYIESSGLKGNDRVKSFVEKPKESVADQLMKTTKHYWNAGVFLFKNQIST